MGTVVVAGDHKAELQLSNSEVSVKTAFQVPPIPLVHEYINLTAAGTIVTRNGELGFSPSAIELGKLKIPNWLLQFAGPFMVGREWHDGVTEPFFQSLRMVEITDGVGMVSYGHLDPKQGFARDALVGLGMIEDLEAATNAHVERLIALAERSSTLSFRQCIETVFAKAKTDSMNGEAARENRAAILALGYLLGHPRIRTFVGPDIVRPSDEVKEVFRKVTLSNRQDWTQHYTVSAALQVLSNAFASMDVGVLKEELDAVGGSGFSFGDLLADRAGTMFAIRATQSESAASAMQVRIVNGFAVTDFIPDAADLPEGLSDEVFKRRYGGVGGAEYQRLIAEIDGRIENCPAYLLPLE